MKMRKQQYRVCLDPEHRLNPKRETERLVDGLVSPSGVFGIHRDDEVPLDDISGVDRVYVIDHLPTGHRINVFFRMATARRFVEIIEHDSERFNCGSFGDRASDMWDEDLKMALISSVLHAEDQAEAA